jgi:hypothetical protein
MYLPVLGSHLTSWKVSRGSKKGESWKLTWLFDSKELMVISATELLSWNAFSALMTGAYVARGKWILGKLWDQLQHGEKESQYQGLTVPSWSGTRSNQRSASRRTEARR